MWLNVAKYGYFLQARGLDNGLNCSKLEICENCMSFDDRYCTQPKHFYRYFRVARVARFAKQVLS